MTLEWDKKIFWAAGENLISAEKFELENEIFQKKKYLSSAFKPIICWIDDVSIPPIQCSMVEKSGLIISSIFIIRQRALNTKGRLRNSLSFDDTFNDFNWQSQSVSKKNCHGNVKVFSAASALFYQYLLHSAIVLRPFTNVISFRCLLSQFDKSLNVKCIWCYLMFNEASTFRIAEGLSINICNFSFEISRWEKIEDSRKTIQCLIMTETLKCFTMQAFGVCDVRHKFHIIAFVSICKQRLSSLFFLAYGSVNYRDNSLALLLELG